MTSVDTTGPEPEGDDIVAAEYVLGVLPADERTAATRRIDLDAAFSRIVDKWEVYFSPLAAAYQAVEAPAGVKPAVDRRLFTAGAATQAPAPRETGGGLLSSLGFWRGLAAAAIAVLAIYVVVPLVIPPVQVPQTRLVASLAPNASDVSYLAVYDPAAGEVSLSHVSGDRGAGHDYELWMVEGKNAPVSMGVIPAGDTARLPVTPEIKAKLDKGVALAISLEPAGGSPNGKPTQVVAVGGVQSI
jgi:anti-sigma-K factor RskA